MTGSVSEHYISGYVCITELVQVCRKEDFVADGQKIPQVMCTEISRLNIQKSGRSFYAIFSPVYIELVLVYW
jgi:hypothetical protein